MQPMDYIQKYSGLVALVILAIMGVSGFFNAGSKMFGSVSCQSTTCLTGGLRILDGVLESDGTMQVGSSGTAQTNQVTATCAMKADVSITASSTGYAFCTGVTGVTSSDYVLSQFATSTTLGATVVSDNFWIVSAKASSTAGAIDFLIYNGSGRSVAPSAAGRAASTTAVFASH